MDRRGILLRAGMVEDSTESWLKERSSCSRTGKVPGETWIKRVRVRVRVRVRLDPEGDDGD